MEEKWMVHTKRADFYGIAGRFGIDPVTARILTNRGVKGDAAIEEYLHGGLDVLPSPLLMRDMEKAAALADSKIAAGKRIRVIGDYDVDGICASYILVKALGMLGAEVDCDIPERIRDGYGLNIRLVEKAHADGIDTIITCDNGIAAASEIARAKKLGMTVIVTDHHEVPFETEDGIKRETLPPADAVVDPHREGCAYPFKNICGAEVALKLVGVLFEKHGLCDPGTPVLLSSAMRPFVEAAGLAAVCDVMPLQGENRTLVRRSLELMQNTDITGLAALIRANGIEGRPLTSYHFGFVIGPCLNAGGRLSTAKKSLGLLLADDYTAAETAAAELKALNEERKLMTERGTASGIEQIEKGTCGDKVYVVYLPDCHESVAGIIAGKLRERYEHPVIVITDSEGGLKGSGRSTEAYSMFEKLSECKGHLTKFGGHPMAAGLSLLPEELEPLRRDLNACSGLEEKDFEKKVWIDVAMPFSYVTEKLINEFALLEPFGTGNPKPVFAEKGLRVVRKRLAGKNKNVLMLDLAEPNGNPVSAVMFNDAAAMYGRLAQGCRISALYYPSVNEYNGRRSLQMVITSCKCESADV